MFYYRYKKYIFLFFIIICISPFYIVATHARLKEVSAQYHYQINAKEQVLMNEFFSMLNITKEEFEVYKEKVRPILLEKETREIKQQSSIPLPPDIKTIIDDMIEQFGPPRAITILNNPLPSGADAQATYSSITISETVFRNLHTTYEEMYVTIMHELIHLKYKDALIAFCLSTLKDQYLGIKNSNIHEHWLKRLWSNVKLIFKEFDVQKWNNLIDCWHKFREWRADVEALLNLSFIDTKYLEARITFWKRFIKTHTYQGATHDSPEQRLEQAEKLLAEINS